MQIVPSTTKPVSYTHLDVYKRQETTVITKHIPPDTGAAAFWLKNRRPDKWRDKPEPEGDAVLLKKAKELLEDIDSVVDKEAERIPDEL